MAQTAEPSSAYNVFIKIKVLLMKSNAPAASEELPKLLAAEDFTLDLLRASGCHPACLPNWHSLIMSQGLWGAFTMCPGSYSVLLQCYPQREMRYQFIHLVVHFVHRDSCSS